MLQVWSSCLLNLSYQNQFLFTYRWYEANTSNPDLFLTKESRDTRKIPENYLRRCPLELSIKPLVFTCRFTERNCLYRYFSIFFLQFQVYNDILKLLEVIFFISLINQCSPHTETSLLIHFNWLVSMWEEQRPSWINSSGQYISMELFTNFASNIKRI